MYKDAFLSRCGRNQAAEELAVWAAARGVLTAVFPAVTSSAETPLPDSSSPPVCESGVSLHLPAADFGPPISAAERVCMERLLALIRFLTLCTFGMFVFYMILFKILVNTEIKLYGPVAYFYLAPSVTKEGKWVQGPALPCTESVTGKDQASRSFPDWRPHCHGRTSSGI